MVKMAADDNPMKLMVTNITYGDQRFTDGDQCLTDGDWCLPDVRQRI